MCGIAGKAYFDFSRTITEEEVRVMTDEIVHRGPDDFGIYINRNVGLGFRRLSIIDLELGHQPISTEDEMVWLTFNGEIYNFNDERLKLEKLGHRFRTKSDSEVLLNLYMEYGKCCVDHLRGMFAFVILDKRNNTLFGARDRFGIKPFHYLLDDEKFLWGSELKSIYAAGASNDLNLYALDDYLTYGYVLGEKSIFSGINKLAPGHTISVELGTKKVELSRYWQVSFQPDHSKNPQYWQERIYSVLKEAVKLRMVSDVPIGAFLSGGIDSSSVVALMAQCSTNPIKTFSIGFKDKRFNELDEARKVAAMYGTDHHEQVVEPESVNLLPKLIDAFDEPFADSSAVPTYIVSEFARKHVTVSLSGDGGDELFAGYSRYGRMANYYNRPLNNGLVNKLFSVGHKVFPETVPGKGTLYYLSKNKNEVAAHTGIFKQEDRAKLYRSGMWSKLHCQYAEQQMVEAINENPKNDFITRLQYNDIRHYMVDDILTKVDRTSMMNSLEVRVPVLDHVFFELSAQIPSEMKFNGGTLKQILKDTMKPHLPKGFTEREKLGFGVPLSSWFKNELSDFVFDTLGSSNTKVSNYLNQRTVNGVLKNQSKSRRDLSAKVWSLLVLEMWMQKYA